MDAQNGGVEHSPVEISIDQIVDAGVLSEVRMMPERATLTCTFEQAEVKDLALGLVRLSAGSVVWLQYVTYLPPIINNQNGCHYIKEVEDSPIPAMVETTTIGAFLHHPLASTWARIPEGSEDEEMLDELVHVRLASFITIEFACPRKDLKLTFEPEPERQLARVASPGISTLALTTTRALARKRIDQSPRALTG